MAPSLRHRIISAKKEAVIIIAILIVATYFRFWDLTAIGIRGDEAVYAGQALILAGEEEMNRFFILASRGTSNFLLHQGIQALVYTIGGFSDFTTRLLPAVFSILTVATVFLLGRELFGRWTGLLAAFLLAINGYAIALGRLALLDTTMVFFFTLSMLFLAKWTKSGESKWMYLLAASTGIAIMTKVTALLIIPIVVLTIFTSGQFRNLNSRTVTGAGLVFLGSVTPAIMQIMSDPSLYLDFFFEGTSRISNVPATYYLDKLIGYAGTFFLAVTILGIAVSSVLRRKGDLHCLIWLGVVAIFFQLYSLKGWNYLLPLVPVATILAGRGLIYIIALLKPLILSPKIRLVYSRKALAGLLGILLLATASYSQVQASLYNNIHDRPFIGLREAAHWLEDNAPTDAGVMTLSHGSAQYVLSLYSGIDSYPFGQFRLHTVLPGGETLVGAPPPEPLIQDGTVTYFVHYIAKGGDDPIHIPVKTPTEDRFVDLIQKYQSNTRYVFYDRFVGLDGNEIVEPRLWIYEVGKRLPEPELELQVDNGLMYLRGSGFLIDSYVSVYYGNSLLKKISTDSMGSFADSVKVPEKSMRGEQLVVFDDAGNKISTSPERDMIASIQKGDGMI